MQELNTRQECDAAFDGDASVIFKHSTQCPISANARREMESFTSGGEPVPVYMLDVNERRELSDYVAERTGIEHQSPQVVLLRGGNPEWHASRFDISARTLRDQLGLASQAG
jgi:bacillithiol system protein YtxJ